MLFWSCQKIRSFFIPYFYYLSLPAKVYLNNSYILINFN